MRKLSLVPSPVTDLFVVVFWGKILTVPLDRAEAEAFRALVADTPEYRAEAEHLALVPWSIARGWVGAR